MGEFVFLSRYSVMNNDSCPRERNSIRESLLPSGASNIATRKSSYQY